MHLDLCSLLLQVMVRDSYSMTPLHYAIQKGHRDMVSLLQRFASNKQRPSDVAAGQVQAHSPSGRRSSRGMHHTKSALLTPSSDQLLGIQSQSALTVPDKRQGQSQSPNSLMTRNGIFAGRRRSQPSIPVQAQVTGWRSPQRHEEEPL